MNLYDIILQSASSALELQRDDGSMPPGWNGPYHQQETPVRNTAHWLITFLKAYEITEDRKYKDAAKKCVEYLLSNEARPMNATFWHRKAEKKDKCNGLIGQAWTIEALSIAEEKLGLKECKEIAEEIFFLHPFNEKCGLWKRVDIDGKILDFDYVFNHQLWFAASASMIENREIDDSINVFMDKLTENIRTDETGLIHHFLLPDCNTKTKIYSFLINVYLLKKGKKFNQILQEGYQAFNLYALALLKKKFPFHSFWDTNLFTSSLNHITLQSYYKYLENNRYGSPYNPAGFENAFAIHVFSDKFEESESLISEWASWQIKKHFDFEEKMIKKNTEDPVTLSARIYEATRLPDIPIKI